MASFTCSVYVTSANDTILQNLGASSLTSPVGIMLQYLIRTATTTPVGFIYTGDISEVNKLVTYLTQVFSSK